MAQIKISNNLYKYNENNYLISINRKNSDGELVKVQEYFKAPTDEDAINYRDKIYEKNNIKVIKKKNKKKNVSKYIYQYGKDYYRITIEKSKLFPKRIDEYHYLPLKDVIEIRDDYIAKARLKKIEKTSLNKKYEGWTLNQFKDEYIEKYCINKLSAVTVNWYDNILNTYILPEYGDVKLDSLEKMISELQEFVNGLKDIKKLKWHRGKLVPSNKTISTKTQHSIYGTFKGILGKAVDFKAIESNPFDSIDPPKVETKKIVFFTLNEMYDVLDLLKKEDLKLRFLITLVMCSGIRRGELVGLHIDDFDFDNNLIYINREVVSAKKYGGVIEKQTKSKNGVRVIPLPAFCMDMAKLYFKERENIISNFKNIYGDTYEAPNNVFISRFGKIMYPTTPYSMWIKFRDKYGLKEVTFHGLRHSWCTAELHENAFLTDVEVAKLMGHGKNVDMTKHYDQPVDSRLNKASSIFSDYEESLKTAKGTLVKFNYEQLITILSCKPYININETKEMISKYYSIDNVPFDEITIRLYGMQEDLLSYDSYYQTIKNYLSSDEHNDWDILTAGKEKFGTNFSFIKSKLDDIKLGKDEISLPKIF